MRKMLVICVMAVMTLTLVGFGFAKWSDTVTISSDVETGNLQTTIAPGGVNDRGADPQYGPGHNEEGKDVASIECVQGEGENADHSLNVTINNGYPFYKPGFTFVITSTGTVPVKIEDIQGPNWQGDLADYIKIAGWSFTVDNPAAYGLPAQEFTVESDETNSTWEGLVEAIGHQQLHQNGTLTVNLEFYIDETDNGQEDGNLCPMNASATGTITIKSSQWNEVGTAETVE
ncbi:hypothetical protein [Syntrophothermus lipocalidus]|uniref:SipW-cognate class signal peptide n=1 Tax=Syntrophothermus lipocalidus (strain DSM 12680 / TGB-C1) TaxID=643648 RepID=D7CMU7_SYNLT|nr:hypothetical protein [Syntrophothermus lipocalidus]ADI02032.1 hypothetical protein Slip_1260 [Syntrophothermus lipocalidus DSM 12680]